MATKIKVEDIDKPILIVMSGVAGSGKSTLVSKIIENSHRFGMYQIGVVSPDAIRIEKFGSLLDTPRDVDTNSQIFSIAHKRIRSMLENKEDVIFDATNIRLKYRSDIYRQYSDIATVVIAQLDASLTTLLNRNDERDPDKVVPEDVIRNMWEQLDDPVYGVDCDYVLGDLDISDYLEGHDTTKGVIKLGFGDNDIANDEKEVVKMEKLQNKEVKREDSLLVVENILENIKSGELLLLRNGKQVVVTPFAGENQLYGVILDDDFMVEELETIDIAANFDYNGRANRRNMDIVRVLGLPSSQNWSKYYTEAFDESIRKLQWVGNRVPLLTDFEFQVLDALKEEYKDCVMTMGDYNEVVLIGNASGSDREIFLTFGFKKLFIDFACTLDEVTVRELMEFYLENKNHK